MSLNHYSKAICPKCQSKKTDLLCETKSITTLNEYYICYNCNHTFKLTDFNVTIGYGS